MTAPTFTTRPATVQLHHYAGLHSAMWHNYYRSVGYSRLLYTNTVSVLEIPSLSAALGGQDHSVGVLLTATDETAAHRLAQREIGTALHEHIERSKRAAARLDASGTACTVKTGGRSMTSIATEVLLRAGWLPQAERGMTV